MCPERAACPVPSQEFGIHTTEGADRDERIALGLPDDADTSALCLSGGGIRSAAFCLGVIQALAGRTLLTRFHYLSTVSGGGYVGGWLSRWIASADGERMIDRQALPKLDALRAYTNYLTPDPGPASTDTWQAVTIWLRNTLINWTLFAPLMLAAALLPILHLLLLRVLAQPGLVRTGLAVLLGLAAAAFLFRSILNGCLSLPSHSHPDVTPDEPGVEFGRSAGEISTRIIDPALLWAFLASLAVAPVLQHRLPEGASVWQVLWDDRPFSPNALDCQPTPDPDDIIWTPPCDVWKPFGTRTKPSVLLQEIESARDGLIGTRTVRASAWPDLGTMRRRAYSFTYWLLPVGSLVAGLAAYAVAWFRLIHESNWKFPRMRDRHMASFRSNILAWIASCIGSASLLYLGITFGTGHDVGWIVVLGPAWIVAADVLRSTLYVALRREGIRVALDREWLGRLNGSKLRAALGYAAAAWAVLFLPRLVLDGSGMGVLTGIAVFSAGPVGALLGKSAQTAFSMIGTGISVGKSRFQLAWILSAISLVFIFGLFMLFGRLDATLVLWIAIRSFGMTGLPGSMLAASVLVFGVSAVLAVGLGRIVKANRFSMHAVYANRLVRAFLGSARNPEGRHPDRYTLFDPNDNVRVADLIPPCGRPFLFPVINVALNVTRTEDTARAERKAKSFTITPRHCGSWSLGGRDPETGREHGAFVPTRYYAGGKEQETGPDDEKRGISLGTAMTLSGAAASPNMGYHSSMLTAFVMTLFNVRLGAWLPNPALPDATPEAMQRSSPGSGLWPMLRELLGRSDDRGESVYLSDGGHFDNLGLYEMLRRRCARIVVIDADADDKYAHQDLARTLLHARIDFGIDVRFDPSIETGATQARPPGAWGLISYPASAGQPARTGCLLYVKACLPENAPIELQSYKALHTVFPHTPTADQFFDEIDFESYRSLGELQARNVLADCPVGGRPTLERWFDPQRDRLLRTRTGNAPTPAPAPTGASRSTAPASATSWRLLVKRAGWGGR